MPGNKASADIYVHVTLIIYLINGWDTKEKLAMPFWSVVVEVPYGCGYRYPSTTPSYQYAYP